MAVWAREGIPHRLTYSFFFSSKKPHKLDIPFGLLEGGKRRWRETSSFPQRSMKTQVPMPWCVSPQQAFHLLCSTAEVAFS